jgi:hypothetical protein
MYEYLRKQHLTLILLAKVIYDGHFFIDKMLQKVLRTNLLGKLKLKNAKTDFWIHVT